MADLGFTADEITAIEDDCRMSLYLLAQVNEIADQTRVVLHGLSRTLEKAATGSVAVDWPSLPTWPDPQPAMVPPWIGTRRSAWVARAKSAPGYGAATVGRTLGLELRAAAFAPDEYVAELRSAEVIGPAEVRVKAGKAGGQVNAVRLQMKRGRDAEFATVATFTALAYVDRTPLAVPGVPEQRNYRLVALKHDVPVGFPSPVLTVLVG